MAFFIGAVLWITFSRAIFEGGDGVGAIRSPSFD
jgi:hypothetical protein